jgi:diketogulonate reductase-like aldo/keto reductase
VFQLIILPHGRKPTKPKPARAYRNPIFLAQEWKKMLESGEYASQSDLARKVGVSRARVNQMLRLLKLPREIQYSVIQMGDPLLCPKITERKLRNLLTSQERVDMKLKSGQDTVSRHVFTMIWKRGQKGWQIIHSHESWVDEPVK